MLPESFLLIEKLKASPSDNSLRQAVDDLRVKLAEEFAALPSSSKTGQRVENACRSLEALANSGVLAFPVSNFERYLDASNGGGWPRLFSTLCLVPSWNLPDAPGLDALPYDFWGLYTRLRLIVPTGFQSAGDSGRCRSSLISFLRDLVRLLEVNRGSSAVRSAMVAYDSASGFDIFLNVSDEVGELAALRARIFALRSVKAETEDLFPISPDGRRLKVGFILQALDPNSWSGFQLFPYLMHLDQSRFDVHVYVRDPEPEFVSVRTVARTRSVSVISQETEAAFLQLRSDNLDVAVFETHSLGANSVPACLMLRRVAPLQVAFDETGFCPGFPGTDLTFQEWAPTVSLPHACRATMPFTGVRLRSTDDNRNPSLEWSREALGVPAGALLVACVAPFQAMTPEWLEACFGELSAFPDTHVLLYSPHPADRGPDRIAQFFRVVEFYLTKFGIEVGRIILSNERFETLGDVEGLLRLADVHFGPVGRVCGAGSLLALEAGAIPLVTTASNGQESLGHLFSKLGLGNCVGETLQSTRAKLRSMLQDEASRRAVRDSVARVLSSPELIEDPTAFGLAFGEMLIRAYGVIYSQGGAAFLDEAGRLAPMNPDDAGMVIAEAGLLLEAGLSDEALRRVISVLAADPTVNEARNLYSKINLHQKRYIPVVDSLLVTIGAQGDRADLWFMLAQALRGTGRRDDALKALETAARLDPKQIEYWRLMRLMAAETANIELQNDIDTVIADLEQSGGIAGSSDTGA